MPRREYCLQSPVAQGQARRVRKGTRLQRSQEPGAGALGDRVRGALRGAAGSGTWEDDLMEHKTWTTVDKSTCGDGPWMAEVDKEQWAEETTGLPCLIKRNDWGALCGYVGVTEGHP